jgi:MraZ protein
MAHFLGEFDCKLDDKFRMALPSGLKKQLPGVEKSGLVVNRGFEKHLVLYSREEWDKITAELGNLNLYEAKSREFVRYFTRGATELAVDSSGRVLLPKNLLEFAGIKREVVLSCQLSKIELWSKEAWDSQLEKEPEDFARLAEEVMGARRSDG